MFPPSEYATPSPSFRRPVPLPRHGPDENPTISICINQEWIPYIAGALKQLLLQATWDTNDLNELHNVQSEVFDLIAMFAASSPCESPVGLSYEEINDMVAFREDCDCNLFYKCCDGTEKQIALARAIPASTATDTGEPTPGPGQTQSYCKTLLANNKVLLAAVVSTGDIITLVSASGSGNDGVVLRWDCHDGLQFFASACVPATGVTSGTDPMPAENHMSLIANIGGTFYSLEHGPITVPGGVSNALVSIQVNDSLISDNAGSYSVCVDVQNNALASWSHEFDLALAPGPFGLVSMEGGEYIAGVGWSSTYVFPYQQIQVRLVLPSATYASMSMDVDSTASGVNMFIGIVSSTTAAGTPAPGHNHMDFTSPLVTGNNVFFQANGGSGAVGTNGQYIIKKITFTGTGTDPF